MKLADLKRSGEERPVWSAPVADVNGNTHYELSITGPGAAIEEVFAKSDFEIEIAPGAPAEEAEAMSKRFLKKHVGDRRFDAPSLDDILTLRDHKPPAAPDNLKDAVTVYLRPTEGEGTLWVLWFPVLFVPVVTPLLFILPRCWWTWSMVIPYTGNPDLILFRDIPAPPFIADTAFAPGTTVEGVEFVGPALPWAQSHPWHNVFTFTAPTLTDFAMGGHSIPWIA